MRRLEKIQKEILNSVLAILLAGGGLYFTSCEDLLDKQPLDAISANDVFTDAGLLQSYVNAIYRGVKPHYEPEAGGYIGLTDLAVLQEGVNNIGGVGREYLSGGLTSDNVDELTNGLWRMQFQQMARVNTFFEETIDSEIDPGQLDPMKGEMHFIRAWIYYELSRNFGGVPIITEPFGLNDESFERSRNTYDEVAQFVLDEAGKAAGFLAGLNMPTGRTSEWAAKALQARMLLYMASPLNNPSNDLAKWQTAAAATKEIIDAGFSLHPTYADLFHEPVKTDEIIFGRDFTGTNRVESLGWGLPWGYNYDFWPSGFDALYKVAPTQNFVNMFQMTSGEYPYLSDGVTVNPAAGFDPNNPNVNRDPRYYDAIIYVDAPVKISDGSKSTERTFEYWEDANPDIPDENPNKVDPINGQELFDFGRDSKSYWVVGLTPFHWNVQTGYAFRKLLDFEGPRASLDFDYSQVNIYLRLAEFYLNYAEIQIALGNEDEARTYINMIRKRESVNMPDITSSGADLVRDYRNERAIELHLEDTRFYDLMRWKAAPGTVDTNPTRGIELTTRDWSDGGKFEYFYGDITTDRTTWPGDHYYLFPIPRDEINKSNGSLVQNPGYN